MNRSSIKSLIVVTLSWLPRSWWTPASRIVASLWPGFRRA